MFKNIFRKIINAAGYDLINIKFEALKKQQYEQQRYKKIVDIIPAAYTAENDRDLIWDFISFAGKRLDFSSSQIMQDLLVLFIFREKGKGYFVEFGATDGVYLSNTYLLEKRYGWQGILSEPAKIWHQALFQQRSCHIEKDCVWSKTGDKLLFNETENPEISTLEHFTENDSLAASRTKGKKYEVPTISLLDLLKKYNAPSFIDYISLDTEGSELEILAAFDFKQFSFGVITVEHNFSDNRQNIYDLLTREGYVRILEPLSMYDDWYVHKDIYQSFFKSFK